MSLRASGARVAGADGAVLGRDVDSVVGVDDGASVSTTSGDKSSAGTGAGGGTGARAAKKFEMDSCLKRLHGAGEDDIDTPTKMMIRVVSCRRATAVRNATV